MRIALLLLCCAGLGACAAPGPYPSLAVRDVERRYAARAVEAEAPPAPPVPADAALVERVRALVAQAEAGQVAFATELPEARAAAAGAGAAGADAWVQAQQAISRAEAARAPTTRALGDLDALVLRQAEEAALSAADYELLVAAIDRVAALRDGQDQALAALKAGLRPV